MPQQASPFKAITDWIDRTVDRAVIAVQFAFLVVLSFALFIFCSIVTILVFAKFLAWVFS